MSLISEIQQDILRPSARLSSTLRKAKVLAYQLGNPAFKAWVEHELDGYPESEDPLPDYRKVDTQTFGGFTDGVRILRNVPIPPMCLPDAWREFAESISFSQGIRSLESLAEGEDLVLHFPWPANLVAMLQGRVYQGMTCLDAHRVVSRNQFEQITDTVKNRLLTFLLELEQIEPNLGETSPADKPSIAGETITRVFNTVILGGHNVVGTSTPFSEGELTMGDTYNRVAAL